MIVGRLLDKTFDPSLERSGSDKVLLGDANTVSRLSIATTVVDKMFMKDAKLQDVRDTQKGTVDKVFLKDPGAQIDVIVSPLSWHTFNSDLTTDNILGANGWVENDSNFFVSRDTTNPKFGAGCLFVDGGTAQAGIDGVSTAVGKMVVPNIETGLTGYTVEFWPQFTNTDGDTVAWLLELYADFTGAVNPNSLVLRMDIICRSAEGFTSGVTHFDNSVSLGGFSDASFSVARNTSYNHLEFAYDGTTVRVFWNGVQKASAVVSAPFASGTDHRWQIQALNLQDDIDDCRLDNFKFWGYCRHTGNFTPPTTESG